MNISIVIIVLQFITLGLIFKKYRDDKLPIKEDAAPRRAMIVDSCGLIDGRIVEVINNGFAPDQIIVPQFIIAELQMLADGRDAHKRERARFGLDIVKMLQASNRCEVSISSELRESREPTDHKLVELAKSTGGQLYTTDYNLNKVAEIEGVTVLNINELAQNLRPTVLPGERKSVKIIQKGSGSDQGVGYLSDGTMVVVNGAGKSMGKSVDVEIDRTFQTVAGKMLFGNIVRSSQIQAASALQPPVPVPKKALPLQLRRNKQSADRLLR